MNLRRSAGPIGPPPRCSKCMLCLLETTPRKWRTTAADGDLPEGVTVRRGALNTLHADVGGRSAGVLVAAVVFAGAVDVRPVGAVAGHLDLVRLAAGVLRGQRDPG